jgi:threonylcarbamoyladenosine tRNA methylthiotransferase MtaB
VIDSTQFHKKRVRFVTLGCKLNFSESSSIGRMLADEGFIKAGVGELADMVVVNTCSVTDLADKKCRNAIRSVIRKNPGAYVVVTGCYAQLKPEELSNIEGVNLVLGTNEKFDIKQYTGAFSGNESEIHVSKLQNIRTFYPSFSHDDRTRCFLKIQDGCDYYCSYCTIPFARGRSRSGSVAETIASAINAIDQGAREIILTGVNIGDFGKGTNETFFDLLMALDKIDADVRFRVGSVEPNLLTDDIIDLMSVSKKIVPHFHIPLQSGSDEVLRLMRRKYTTSVFTSRIEKIQSVLPHAFIGVDVIVGVNGETDELFNEAYNFLQQTHFSQLHVFSYSERPGTQALAIDYKVSPQQKKVRSQLLLDLSDKRLREFYNQQSGKQRIVLFEFQKQGENMVGFTQNYVKVVAEYRKDLINTFVPVLAGDYNRDAEALNCKIIEQ